ncbi:MAG: iron(III) transport system substrate-binding protein [Alphaproteobacteria bacterium]|jgi:iron(III) transport system substrate-binding protein|nr:iron(III) transport system substrate-binding protein [Alphaproteobacteria bacterium]
MLAALTALLALITLTCPPALAQTRMLAEIAAYQGADRTARLIEGAKKEGTVSFYTSLVAEDTTPILDAFKKTYGIEVQVWRASTETLVQRAVNESRAGRCPADLFHSGSHALEPLHRERLLQAINSPATAAVMPQARSRHGEYTGMSVNVFAAAYNTSLVKADEVPTSYEDLKHPRWKGRLAIEADDSPWFAALLSKVGETAGLKLFRDIVQVNGISARKGHTLLANMVVAGEVPLALTVFSYKSDQLQKAGAPIRTFYLPPVVALSTAVSVSRCTTRAHAAILLYDFMLTEAQTILAPRDMVSTNPKVRPPPPGIELTFMDPAQMLDDGRKWTELWEKTFIRPQ